MSADQKRIEQEVVVACDAMKCDPDERHAENVCDATGVGGCSKCLCRPFVRETWGQEGSRCLHGRGVQAQSAGRDRDLLRGGPPRYQIRGDGSLPRDGCARARKSSVARVMRLARYLAEFPSLVWDRGRKAKDDEDAIHVFAGIDWADDTRISRWTSVGLVFPLRS